MRICTGLGSDGNWLVSPRMAAEYDRSRPIEESDCYPKGITGQQYFAHAHERLVYPVTFVELVPEPTNEHDSNAIFVRAQGQKIGYVPADRAAHLHSTVAFMRNEGIRCYVPLTTPEKYEFDDDEYDFDDDDDEYDFDDDDDEYDFDDDDDDEYDFDDDDGFEESHCPQLGVMLLPTHQTLDNLRPTAVLFAEFDRIIDTLGDDFIEELNRSGWRFEPETFSRFFSVARNRMKYPFSTDIHKYDALLWRYLVKYRRIIYRTQNRRKFIERNITIMNSYRSGESSSSIAAHHQLAQSTVQEWIRKGKSQEKAWKKTLKSIPNSYEEIRDKVLFDEFKITEETEVARKEWVDQQLKLDREFEKSQASTPEQFPPQSNQQESSLPHRTVPISTYATENTPGSITHPQSSSCANKPRRGIRGAWARFFGAD